MPNPKPKPHPQNAVGPFYVEDGCCLLCDVPRSFAPEMFKCTDDKQHCFVYRQPESAADLQKMFEVLKTQDIMCIRCRSRDSDLLKQLEEHGLQDVCDFEEKANKTVQRTGASRSVQKKNRTSSAAGFRR